MSEVYREMTTPSGEQATIDHVQGSTELMSQPSITPTKSLILFFTDISAATSHPHQHSQKLRLEEVKNKNKK